MFRIKSIFLIFCALFSNTQAELDVTFFNIDVAYYHPDYFKDVEFFLLDDNKLFGNLTITSYLPTDISLRVSIIASTMGEYIVPTGFNSTFPICELFRDPILVEPTLKALNIPLNKCPPGPGTYTAAEFEADFSLYPDTFPPNNYLTKTELYNDQKHFFELHTYQRIV